MRCVNQIKLLKSVTFSAWKSQSLATQLAHSTFKIHQQKYVCTLKSKSREHQVDHWNDVVVVFNLGRDVLDELSQSPTSREEKKKKVK